jgi:hypothetical protein
MAIDNHPHRERCVRWFESIDSFATCPVTEGTQLRMHHMHAADKSLEAAWRSLDIYRAPPETRFLAGEFLLHGNLPHPPHRIPADHGRMARGVGKRKGGKLATLDEPLSALWPDSTLLIPC